MCNCKSGELSSEPLPTSFWRMKIPALDRHRTLKQFEQWNGMLFPHKERSSSLIFSSPSVANQDPIAVSHSTDLSLSLCLSAPLSSPALEDHRTVPRAFLRSWRALLEPSILKVRGLFARTLSVTLLLPILGQRRRQRSLPSWQTHQRLAPSICCR
jgi:hypothetical protein